MDYRTFQETLLSKMQARLGDQAEAVFTVVQKNNGIVKDALVFRQQGSRISPTIYVEEYYQYYEEGEEIDTLAQWILQIYRESAGVSQMKLELFGNYEEMKYHIFYRLINRGRNQKLLQGIPYLPYLDLAVVCYYRIPEGPLQGGTVLLHRRNLEIWKIEEETLFHHAMLNTPFRLPYTFQGMNEVLRQLDCPWPEYIDEEEEYMYVLTNQERHFGAACILYPNMLAEIGERLGADFFLLPSSIHECIALPACGHYRKEELKAMVQEMNQTQVDPTEVLSDEVYYYSRKEAAIWL